MNENLTDLSFYFIFRKCPNFYGNGVCNCDLTGQCNGVKGGHQVDFWTHYNHPRVNQKCEVINIVYIVMVGIILICAAQALSSNMECYCTAL